MASLWQDLYVLPLFICLFPDIFPILYTPELQCVYMEIEVSSLYFHVPMRRGLRKAALAPGRNETRAINPLVRTYRLTNH